MTATEVPAAVAAPVGAQQSGLLTTLSPVQTLTLPLTPFLTLTATLDLT